MRGAVRALGAVRYAIHRALGHNVIGFPPEDDAPRGGWFCCYCDKDWPNA